MQYLYLYKLFVSDAMIGDTNLFLNDPQEPQTAEVEIMIANIASRGKKRGWESVILMIQYGNLSQYNYF